MSSKDITERLLDYARDYTTTTYHDDLIREAVTEIESLRKQISAAQAAVDALMLEYCPGEMSREQFDNWAAHQRPGEWKTNKMLRKQLAATQAKVDFAAVAAEKVIQLDYAGLVWMLDLPKIMQNLIEKLKEN